MSGKCPVVHFDHHSKEFAYDRDRILRELRAEAPIAYTQSHGGHWVVSSYALANQVLDNPDIFSSEKLADGTRGVTIPSVGPRLLPAEVDPPFHSKLRRALMPAYSPRALKAMEPILRKIVQETVDKLVEKEYFDVVEDVSEVVPPLVGLWHLGFPEEHRATMVEAIKIALKTDIKNDQAAQAFMNACGLMMQFVQQRRREPVDDLMSNLVQCSDPVFSDEDLMWVGITLFVGGFKNPGAHISNMLIHLEQDRELRTRLIKDRALIPAATNEFLRFYTSGVSVARNVTRPTTLGGVELSEGERVLVVLPGANHDESVFERPDEFDINRPAHIRHLAFGGGPHYCIGFKLASMMFDLLLNEIFDRIPDYTIDVEKAVRVEDAGIQYGYISAPAHVGTAPLKKAS